MQFRLRGIKKTPGDMQRHLLPHTEENNYETRIKKKNNEAQISAAYNTSSSNRNVHNYSKIGIWDARCDYSACSAEYNPGTTEYTSLFRH